MNVNRIKRLIIILMIITVLIACFTLILTLSEKGKEKSQLQEQQDLYADMLKNPTSILNGQKPQVVQDENMYFNVKSSIESYLKYTEEKNAAAICNLLDEEYMQNNGINKDNVLAKINTYTNVNQYEISEMYELNGVRYFMFYIKGTISGQEILLNANLDFTNETFSIIPMEQEEFEKALDTTVENQSGNEKEIVAQGYNKIQISTLQEGEIARKYLLDYVECMKNNPEKAYDLLDTKYREKRFATLEEYKKYISDNMSKIETITATSYRVEEKDNQTQYICKDNYDNYYIFKKRFAMNYKVLLDNYTIESEEYNEQYNQLSEEQKVKTNLERYMKLINSKSYKQAYEKLNQEFKQNYFKTQAEFENYIKNKFFEDNLLGVTSIKKQGNVYVCEISIKESLSTAARSADMTFIVLLKENNDFEISFTV